MIRIIPLLLLLVSTASYSQDCQCDTLKSPKGFGYQGSPIKIADNEEAMVATTSLSMLQFGPDTVLRTVIFVLATTKSRGSDIASITVAAQDGSEAQLSDAFQKRSRQSSSEDGRNAEYAASYILTPEQLPIILKPLKEIVVHFEGGDKIVAPTDRICTKCIQLSLPPIKRMIADAIKSHEYECDITRNGKDTDYRCRSRSFELQKDDDIHIYADVSATKPGKGKTTYTLGFLIKQSTITDISQVQVTTRDGVTLSFENGIQGERNSAGSDLYQFFVSYSITKKQLDALSKPLQGFTFTFENGDVVETSTLHICTECAQKAGRK